MTYVSFGPAATNQNIYRASIIKKLDKTPFSMRAEAAINYITSTLIKGYHADLEKMILKNFTFDGHQAVMAVSKLNTSRTSFINVVDVIDDKNFVLLFSADLYPENNEQSIEIIKNAILQRQNIDWNRFIKSFQFYN